MFIVRLWCYASCGFCHHSSILLGVSVHIKMEGFLKCLTTFPVYVERSARTATVNFRVTTGVQYVVCECVDAFVYDFFNVGKGLHNI